MLFSINTNANSAAAQKNLPRALSAARTNVQKLSAGSNINSSSDDAAGLGVSESLKSQPDRRQSLVVSDSLMRTTGIERYRIATLLRGSGTARDDRYSYESSGLSNRQVEQQKQLSTLSQYEPSPHYTLRLLG